MKLLGLIVLPVLLLAALSGNSDAATPPAGVDREKEGIP